MILGLALFAHQGFSTNLFGLTTDVFPARIVGSAIGIGEVERSGERRHHGIGLGIEDAIALASAIERLLERQRRWEDLIELWQAQIPRLPLDEARSTRVRIAAVFLDHLEAGQHAVVAVVSATGRDGIDMGAHDDRQAILLPLEDADDIADGDIVFTFSRAGNGGCQLWQTGTDSNHR